MLAIGRVGRTVLPDFLGVILTHDAIHAVATTHQVKSTHAKVKSITPQVKSKLCSFLRGAGRREILPVAYFGPEGGNRAPVAYFFRHPRFL